ncbi:MAG: LysR family transcriptional regulator [Bdellovibrionales bacterium]|nr:LysR family transcriptional regulator [Bdellovibrionales bacterium]
MLTNAYDLRYFLEVSATLNVSRAAERLGISQPSLSLAIRRLEGAVGAPLLIRLKHGVRLTPAGVKVSARAKNLLEDWEKLRADALESQEQVKGRLVVGCHPSVALYSLPAFVSDIVREHAGLELNFSHGLSRVITEEVISFRTDVGIVVNPVQHPDLVIKEICRDEVTLWCAPGGIEDILISDGDLHQTQVLVQKLGRSQAQFTRFMNSSNLEVVASLTAEGCGVGILPTRVAKRAHRPLKKFGRNSPVFADRICLIYRADGAKSRAVKEVIRAIGSAKI